VRVKKTDIDKRLIDLVFAEQVRGSEIIKTKPRQYKKDEDYDDLNFD
jgi:hypothetical protein